MDPLAVSIYGCTLAAAAAAATVVYPAIARTWSRTATKVEQFQTGKVDRAARALDDIFVEFQPTWLRRVYWFAPIVVGVVIYTLMHHWVWAVAGVAGGFLLPDLWVKQRLKIRRWQFREQFVDALRMLTSSLRAGLSLTQAFEVLESEMPPPASQEYGLMLKAHRLGRSLEEALQGLNDRMHSEELHLLITAVLVARETGGDVTNILSQLIVTIRERKKLDEKVRTLTLQGRLQAYIMSALPILFATFVTASNPHYFDTLLKDPVGNLLLVLAVGLWIVGMVLLLKLSQVDA